MACTLIRRRFLLRSFGETGKDAALVRAPGVPTTLAKFLELLFQRSQLLDALGHVSDVLDRKSVV